MIILGIETSCDDTCIAIVKTPDKKRGNFKILSNIVSSQIKVHQKYGGVVPNLAAREHLKNIEPCIKQAFKQANVIPEEINLIAVTIGPGLIPCLLIGANFAKALAYKWQRPIIPVNHLEGHIAANWLSPICGISNFQFPISKKLFPAVALVVSGGHTQLVLIKDFGKYKILGETRDDAAGECFDKIAKLLRLGYPGGPEIAKEAAKVNSQFSILNSQLPRPMIKHKNYDFSFSGLKTAVLYLVRNNKAKLKNKRFIQELCKEVQQAIIDVLIDKTIRAAEEYKAKTVILSGGVAANDELRKQLKLKIANCKLQIEFLTPSKILCTDNAAMIAAAGYFKYNLSKPNLDWKRIKADANLRLKSW